MVMRLDSAREVDSIVSMPSMPASEPSSTCVTCALDDLGGGARIVGRNRNLRLVDIGIFPDGQPAEGHQPDQHQDQAEDRREDWAADAEFR